jgi:hypothetical protein
MAVLSLSERDAHFLRRSFEVARHATRNHRYQYLLTVVV